MSCIKPSGYRYWIDNDDGNWYRSEDPRVKMTALLGLYSAPKWAQLSVGGYEAATPIKDGAAARRRVDQPVRFPDADDALLVAILGFLDVSVVGLAAQINRRWRRAAGTRALWQCFVRRRWPEVWAGLAAPTALDARKLYRRLACPQPWRETTPEGVLVLFELKVDGKTMVSATANLGELQTQSAEAGLGTELRLRPRDAANYEKVAALVAQADWDEDHTGGFRAALSLIRRADGAIVSEPDLEILEASEHGGLYFTGILYPNHPLRSFARRRALCQQDENERVAQGLERRAPVPVKQKHYHHFGEQTHELTVSVVFSFDGRPSQFGLAEFNTARDHPEAFRPGDVAIEFGSVIWDGFHRYNDPEYHTNPPSDEEEDNGLVEWNGGSGPGGIKLDKHLLGGLEWPK